MLSRKYNLKYADDPQFHFQYKSNLSNNEKYRLDLLKSSLGSDTIAVVVKKPPTERKPALKRKETHSGIAHNL